MTDMSMVSAPAAPSPPDLLLGIWSSACQRSFENASLLQCDVDERAHYGIAVYLLRERLKMSAEDVAAKTGLPVGQVRLLAVEFNRKRIHWREDKLRRKLGEVAAAYEAAAPKAVPPRVIHKPKPVPVIVEDGVERKFSRARIIEVVAQVSRLGQKRTLEKSSDRQAIRARRVIAFLANVLLSKTIGCPAEIGRFLHLDRTSVLTGNQVVLQSLARKNSDDPLYDLLLKSCRALEVDIDSLS